MSDDWGESTNQDSSQWAANNKDSPDWGEQTTEKSSGWGEQTAGESSGWDNKADQQSSDWGSSNNQRPQRDGQSNRRPFRRGGRSGYQSSGRANDSDRQSSAWGSESNQQSSDWGSGSNQRSSDRGGRSKQQSSDWDSGSNQQSSDWGSGNNRRPFERDNQDNSPRKRTKTDGNDQDKQEDRPAPYRPEELDLDEEVRLQAEGTGIGFERYKEQKITCIVNAENKDSIKPIDKFEDIVKSQLLLKNIQAQKYQDMTPIQKWAMPAIMEGYDLIACAQTGSGKTAAFLLPILQNLLSGDLEPNDPNEDTKNPYCLIISPTRELANQIHVHANMLSRDSIIKCQVIYGQVSTAHLKAKLSTGCHILVSTVGRLKDFVERGWIGFKNIKYVILDEGDRLVDESFSVDIDRFFQHDSMPPKEKRQTLFFSATFKQETQQNARKYLNDHFVFLSVGKIGAANMDIKQEFMQVERSAKKRELKKILETIPESEKTIIFTQTKSTADFLAGMLSSANLSSTSIHGDRHQSQREEAIKLFRRGAKRFLVSSPVGNRGLDLPKVSLVINYDLPPCIDEYVHRIGRTGRAGHTGRALSFYDAERDTALIPELISILTEAKQEVPDWMSGNEQPASITASNVDTGPADDWGDGAWSDNAKIEQKPAETNDTDNWADAVQGNGSQTANVVESNDDAW